MSVTAGSTVACRRVSEVVARIDDRERGRDRELDGEHVDEQRAEHELGQREPDERGHRDQRVRELPFRERRERRQDERDRDVEEESEDTQEECVLGGHPDRRGDGLVVHERAAEVAAGDVGDPDAVSLPDRIVQVEVFPEDLTLLRRRLAAEYALSDVAREHAREEVDERRDDEQRDGGECEALSDEPENQTSSYGTSDMVSVRHPGRLRGRPG